MLRSLIRNFIGDAGTNNDSVREVWVKNALAKVPGGARILDAGAGQQRYRPFCSHLKYVSQDFCQYSGEGDGKALQTGTWNTEKIDLVCDLVAIPEPDRSFDAILCTEVFEHIPDPLAALREFARLLKPHGELLLTAPFCSLTHMGPYHYYSGFNKYFYEYHLPRLGFAITELVANGDYAEYAAQELRRMLEVFGPVSFLTKACIATLLRFVGRKRDRHLRVPTADLLCFGYHVRAVKS